MPELSKKTCQKSLRDSWQNRETTEDLEIGSNKSHHEATNNQWSRCDHDNSRLILGNSTLHFKHKKTDYRASLGKLPAKCMEATQDAKRNNNQLRNGNY